jgi:glutamyl-tRNA(Gln) amidotransferase subunit D
MTEKESAGYFGVAQKTLKSAQVQIGDRVRIITSQATFEGLIIPRADIGADDKHIIIKLDNGYNVGIRVDNIKELHRLAKGAKVKPELPSVDIKMKKGLPQVTIISTGGTIASRVDYRTGAVNPALNAEDLYSVVPELGQIANVKADVLYSLFSENILPHHWTEIASRIAKHFEEASGIVIAHGTDTMGYTAAALSFALQNLPHPVVLTGSQRSSDRPSSDAAQNLTASIVAAAHGPFAEVVLVMHQNPDDVISSIHRGTKVRKCHTSRRDAFLSINTDLLGEIQNSDIRMLADPTTYLPRDPNRQLNIQPNFDPKVALVKTTPGMTPDLINTLIDHSYHGIVIEGTGLGHTPEALFAAINRAREEEIPVAMTSQCIWGRVNMRVYRTGVQLIQSGVIPLEDMLPETAFVKLMWVLAQTRDLDDVKAQMLQNVAGEITQCTKRSQYPERTWNG